MSERSVHIPERNLTGPVHLVERSVRIPERELSGPVHLMQREAKIPERKLAGPAHIIGHEFVRPPVLMTGPTATPAETTCLIEWTVDIPAYHRTRHRETGTEDWTVSAWSGSAGTSASVTIESLTAGTEHDYQVQSCIYGDGTFAFDYAPDPADTFTTESAGDIVFSDFSLGKQPIMQTVIINWITDLATKDRSKWRIRGSSDVWNYTTLSISFVTNHTDNTSMPCTPGAQYEVMVYGITEGDYEEWDVLKYVKISEAGEPEFVN